MISDTLSDAAAEIARYRREQPAVYAQFAAQIDEALAAMERCRIALDTVPAE